MAWFEFRQNNSGGSFVFKHGIGVVVWVEATSAKDANNKAEKLGLYFDGDGDCPCCGDRWYEAYGEGEEEPPAVVEYLNNWAEGKLKAYYAWAHYADGRVDTLPTKKRVYR